MNGEELYVEVPDDFEQDYPGDVMLRTNVLLYGTKQVVYYFFKTCTKCVKKMMYTQLKADPCLYVAWVDTSLAVLVTWVGDMMILGPRTLVEQIQHDLENAFACKHEGELTEYVGSTIMINCDSTGFGTVKFMQPVPV